MTERVRKSRGPLIAHWLWGLLAVSMCALLVLSRGGHPPAIVFLPLVGIVWAAGHVAIWVAGRIAARGRRIASRTGHGAEKWPAGLVAVLVLTGFASGVGIVQLVVSAALRELYPAGAPGIWGLMVSIWIVHGACFAGVLLRKRWSRYLSTALALGWAALLVRQIIDYLMYSRRIDAPELAMVIGLVLVLVAFAYHLMASRRIRRILDA